MPVMPTLSAVQLILKLLKGVCEAKAWLMALNTMGKKKLSAMLCLSEMKKLAISVTEQKEICWVYCLWGLAGYQQKKEL